MTRIQKLLAQAGVASRRAAEEIILAGRVTVNGRVVTVLGEQAEPDDDIRVDGKRIVIRWEKRYIMLHKPAGYVTTLRDPQNRPTVRDLVATIPERLYPVGRLDYDSEGLLFMTNDGDFAFALQHPRFGVPKRLPGQGAGAVLCGRHEGAARRDAALRRLVSAPGGSPGKGNAGLYLDSFDNCRRSKQDHQTRLRSVGVSGKSLDTC